ncbi:MAG: DUF448 domain-containing protein [Hyphomicrobiales bacterium]
MRAQARIVTRPARAKTASIRFALSPDHGVAPDLECRLSGRGGWVGARHDIIVKAGRGGYFARGFRRPVTVRPDLPDHVGLLLGKQALDCFNLADRAGLVCASFKKLTEAVAAGKVVALVEARDRTVDGGGEHLQRIERHSENKVERVIAFDLAEIRLALGGINVLYAGMSAGRLTEIFLTSARKYQAYRPKRQRPARLAGAVGQ